MQGVGPHEPAVVEAALGRGEVGSLLFCTDPAEINRLQRLTIDGRVPERSVGRAVTCGFVLV